MISKLILKNFKLFKGVVPIPLAGLNLLTGVNGRGKSTVLQSLLLLKQSADLDRSTNKVFFNGDDVKLGSYKDVKNVASTSEENIELGLEYNTWTVNYKLNPSVSDPMVADISEVAVVGQLNGHPVDFKLQKNQEFYDVIKTEQNVNGNFQTYLHDLFISDIALSQNTSNGDCESVKSQLNFTKVHYVSADRVGPKVYFEEKSMKGFSSVGALGEDTVNVLYHKKGDAVSPEFLKHIPRLFHVALEELGSTVDQQVEFWLDKIFYGAKYDIKPVEDANLLTFRVSPEGTFNYYKPTNVGYGFSYVLPIIVAGLIAKENEILIVENPEAHLHPHAQSVIAKFLALVSLKRVQVIVESHSEHILNGFRLPIYDGIMPSSNLNVLYFDRSPDSLYTKIVVEEKAGIPNWPPDFFDQATKDFNHLFGI